MNNVQHYWYNTASARDPERAAFWTSIFERNLVPIVPGFVSYVNLPDHPDALVCWLDLDAITPQQRQRLVDGLSTRFDLDPEFVDANLEQEGVPVHLADVTIRIKNPF